MDGLSSFWHLADYGRAWLASAEGGHPVDLPGAAQASVRSGFEGDDAWRNLQGLIGGVSKG